MKTVIESYCTEFGFGVGHVVQVPGAEGATPLKAEIRDGSLYVTFRSPAGGNAFGSTGHEFYIAHDQGVVPDGVGEFVDTFEMEGLECFVFYNGEVEL